MKLLHSHSTLEHFILHGGVRMGTLADFYALDMGEMGSMSISELIHRLRCNPVQGDRISLGALELVVVDAGPGEVRLAGLRFNGQHAARAHRRHAAISRYPKNARPGRDLTFPWPRKTPDEWTANA